MTDADKRLRAAVFLAFDARGTDGYRDALDRVVHVHAIEPLIAAEAAIERAERRLEAGRRHEASLQLLRETGEVLRRVRACA